MHSIATTNSKDNPLEYFNKEQEERFHKAIAKTFDPVGLESLFNRGFCRRCIAQIPEINHRIDCVCGTKTE